MNSPIQYIEQKELFPFNENLHIRRWHLLALLTALAHKSSYVSRDERPIGQFTATAIVIARWLIDFLAVLLLSNVGRLHFRTHFLRRGENAVALRVVVAIIVFRRRQALVTSIVAARSATVEVIFRGGHI